MIGIILLFGCLIAVFHPKTHFDTMSTQLLFFASLGAMGFAWNDIRGNADLYVYRSLWVCYISLILIFIWLPVHDLIGELRAKSEARTRSIDG